MNELGKRVAVAALAIPVVLLLVYLGGWYVGVPLAAFAGWASHEVYRFAEKRDVRALEWIGAPAAAALVLLATRRPSFDGFAPSALGLLTIVAVIALLGSMRSRGATGHPLAASAVTLFGSVYAGLLLAFLPLLRALPESRGWGSEGDGRVSGLLIVILPLAVTWIGDAAAYFAGSAWGRNGRKLAPSISPNKSWVGFWAAVFAGVIAAVLWWLVVVRFVPELGRVHVGLIALAGAGLSVVAVLGDLVESLLKREAGVKDSGTFFPGHGGVLDRIDSLLFTVPSSYVLLVFVMWVS